MADRFLVMAYVQPGDAEQTARWWVSVGAPAVASLPGAGVTRLARVIEGNPTHVVMADWSDMSLFSIAAFYRAFAGSPVAGGPWLGLAPVGAAFLSRQIYPAVDETDPVASTFKPGDHGFVPLTNVDADVEEGFNEWYNSSHLPAVGDAGLTQGTRFETFGTAHKYLATYHIEGPEAMHSEALERVRGFDEYTGRAHDLTRLVFKVIA